jgi:ABC-type spermidine/putrescine transport system permease subunit II
MRRERNSVSSVATAVAWAVLAFLLLLSLVVILMSFGNSRERVNSFAEEESCSST